MGVFYLACIPWHFENFDNFLNSFKVEKLQIDSYVFIALSDLVYKKSHEIIAIPNGNYIISDTLDLQSNITH